MMHYLFEVARYRANLGAGDMVGKLPPLLIRLTVSNSG